MEKPDCLFIGQIVQIQRVFTNEHVRQWNMLTGDFNEVYHQDISLFDLGKPIVPGIIGEGLIMEAISSKLLLHEPYVLVQKEMVFMEPVTVSEMITAQVEIIDINEEKEWLILRVCCMNEQAVEVIKGKTIVKIL